MHTEIYIFMYINSNINDLLIQFTKLEKHLNFKDKIQ